MLLKLNPLRLQSQEVYQLINHLNRTMKNKYETVERQSYDWWLNFWQQWDLFEPIDIELIKIHLSNLQLVEMPNVVGCYQLCSSNVDKILISHIDAPADEIEACTALNALKDYVLNK